MRGPDETPAGITCTTTCGAGAAGFSTTGAGAATNAAAFLDFASGFSTFGAGAALASGFAAAFATGAAGFLGATAAGLAVTFVFALSAAFCTFGAALFDLAALDLLTAGFAGFFGTGLATGLLGFATGLAAAFAFGAGAGLALDLDLDLDFAADAFGAVFGLALAFGGAAFDLEDGADFGFTTGVFCFCFAAGGLDFEAPVVDFFALAFVAGAGFALAFTAFAGCGLLGLTGAFLGAGFAFALVFFAAGRRGVAIINSGVDRHETSRRRLSSGQPAILSK